MTPNHNSSLFKYTPVTITFASNKDAIKQAYLIQLVDLKQTLGLLELPDLVEARLELLDMRAIVENRIQKLRYYRDNGEFPRVRDRNEI